LLLTVFGGITDRLIPLFAVGAFMAFTLSQLGMSFHWLRRKGNGIRLLINGAGAAGTGGALVVIVAAKFVEGAWIVLIVIPCVLALLKTINRYYEMIDRQLRDEGPIALGGLQPPVAVLPLQCWDRLADKAVRYSLLMSSAARQLAYTPAARRFAAPRRPKSRGRNGALGARRAASGGGHRGGGAAVASAGTR
jgi:hypothetical protein